MKMLRYGGGGVDGDDDYDDYVIKWTETMLLLLFTAIEL